MLKIAAIVVFCYGALIVYLYLMQRQLTYYPETTPLPTKEALNQHYQDIKLTTEDGLQLNSWYRKASVNKPTIVYLHGNAGNIFYRLPLAKIFFPADIGVLLLEYRGYANNPGKPSEQGLYMDARAALTFLQNEKIPPQCIILFGESLGTGVAVQMATEYKIGGLILQSAYSSLPDVAQYHYPFIPIKWLMRDQYDSFDKINSIHVPLLMIHGDQDEIVPLSLGQKLFARANQPKELFILKGARHNEVNQLASEGAAIHKFIKKNIVCKSYANNS